MLRTLGFSDVLRLLSGGGLPALAGLFFYPFLCVWDVGAWRLLFIPGTGRPRFAELFWIRLAGEAVNNVTPFIDIGGEPLKVHLVSRRFGLPVGTAAANTVVAKTGNLIAEAAFMVFGALLSFELLTLPSAQRLQLTGALLAVCAVFIGFLLLQMRGAFHGMNPQIGHYYAREQSRFWTAAGLNLLGWAAGGVETWYFCRTLGLDISILEGVMLEALLQLVRTGSFFIPMNLGVQEGGLAFFFHSMGHDPALGVAVSLLKRARQVLWTAAGFLVWGVYQYKEAKQKQTAARADMLSMDTRLDRWIHRPAAELLAWLLERTPVTPNQVTVCTLVPALLATAFFSLGSAAGSLLGILFFYLWSVLDHTDGSLARRKRMTSEWGRWLDDACDAAASTLMLLGIYWGLRGVWNTQDRTILDRLFFLGLSVNLWAAALVLSWKRRVREGAVQRKTVSEGLVWKQRFLDRLTGRDVFYLLLAFVLASHLWGTSLWHLYTFTMGLFIIGLFVITAVSLREALHSQRLRLAAFLLLATAAASCFLVPG